MECACCMTAPAVKKRVVTTFKGRDLLVGVCAKCAHPKTRQGASPVPMAAKLGAPLRPLTFEERMDVAWRHNA